MGRPGFRRPVNGYEDYIDLDGSKAVLNDYGYAELHPPAYDVQPRQGSAV
jgi:hypothetical protein